MPKISKLLTEAKVENLNYSKFLGLDIRALTTHRYIEAWNIKFLVYLLSFTIINGFMRALMAQFKSSFYLILVIVSLYRVIWIKFKDFFGFCLFKFFSCFSGVFLIVFFGYYAALLTKNWICRFNKKHRDKTELSINGWMQNLNQIGAIEPA